MITLKPPVKTDEQLRALAASGCKGLVNKARAELCARTTERLRKAVGS